MHCTWLEHATNSCIHIHVPLHGPEHSHYKPSTFTDYETTIKATVLSHYNFGSLPQSDEQLVVGDSTLVCTMTRRLRYKPQTTFLKCLCSRRQKVPDTHVIIRLSNGLSKCWPVDSIQMRTACTQPPYP